MNQVNEILLRRRNKINLRKRSLTHEPTQVEKTMVVSAMKNVEALGFTFSKELFETLLTYPKSEIKEIYIDVVSDLKKLVGADKEYNPMYPNFPKQVAEAEDIELVINAILHYWTDGKWKPEYKKDERFPLFEDTKLTVLTIGDYDDVIEIFKNLVSSKTSISEQDKIDIASVISTDTDFYKYLPDKIPLKENAVYISKLILDNVVIKDADYISKYFKTATDVLRLITILSDGDISLAVKTKYRSLHRYERTIVMDLLAGCGNILEDMYRYQQEWIRIGEIVHPFTYYQPKYTKVKKAFYALRNEKKPWFTMGLVQKSIADGYIETAVDLLKNRPGELTRRLDELLRKSEDEKGYILHTFGEVASKVSTSVLFQARQHFLDRNNGDHIRVFFPKGNLSKAKSIPNTLSKIDDVYCEAVVDACDKAIMKQAENKEAMGNVFIDEELKNYIVPFNQRSASVSNKNLVRGSRVGLNEDTNVIRAFIWWTNTIKERVDIDLSAAFYNEDWEFVNHISYTKLHSEKLLAYHSGDIIDGENVNGKGVAEFIDINIDSAAKNGRYVVFQIHSFTGQAFSQLPNCNFGWMQREDVNSGEIFEPSMVDMNIRVNANSIVSIPVIFDCVAKQFIWCDMNLSIRHTRIRCGGNNLESNLKGVNAVCYAMTHLSKPDIYTLVKLNAMVRGRIVENRNDADIIFSNDLTPPTKIVAVKDEETGKLKLVKQENKDVKIVTAYDIDYYYKML